MPYVEYTCNVDEDVTQTTQTEKAPVLTNTAFSTPSTAPQQSRAVAKKSTAKRQNNIESITHNSMVETKPSHSIVVSKQHFSD